MRRSWSATLAGSGVCRATWPSCVPSTSVPVRKVPMAELRERLAAAGFTDVETHIQTGNIALTSTMRSQAKVEAAIEELLGEWRGFEVPDHGALSARAARPRRGGRGDPAPARRRGARRYVAFAKGEVSAGRAGRRSRHTTRHPERARVVGRDVLLEIRQRLPRTPGSAGARLERLAGTRRHRARPQGRARPRREMEHHMTDDRADRRRRRRPAAPGPGTAR